jgi:hypothetical protein
MGSTFAALGDEKVKATVQEFSVASVEEYLRHCDRTGTVSQPESRCTRVRSAQQHGSTAVTEA